MRAMRAFLLLRIAAAFRAPALRARPTLLQRHRVVRFAGDAPPPPPALLPVFLQRRWRRALGCEVCGDARAVPCPSCDGAGGYEAAGGVAVACPSCRSTGRVVCRACFVGDGYDIDKIRRDMGYPD